MAQVSFKALDSIAFSGGEAGEITVDVTKLNETVQSYVFLYGLKQMLNDVHAGETAKKTPDEATRVANKQALVAKKLASLYAGEVAQARVGQSGDPVMREMREMAEIDLKAKIKSIGKKVTDFKKSVWQAAIGKQVAAGEAKYRKAAEKKLAVKVETVEIDIDSLFAVEATETSTEEKPTE